MNRLPPALRLSCEFVSACSQGRGLGVPESQGPGSKSPSPLRVIWQESIPPTEARLIITMNLLLDIPRVLFSNATVPLTKL